MTATAAPPYGPLDEAALLGAALITTHAAHLVAHHTVPADWWVPFHAQVAQVIGDIVTAGHPVDVATVTSGLIGWNGHNPADLRRRVGELLTQCPAAANAPAYHAAVKEWARRRRLAGLARDLAAAVAEGGDVDAVLAGLDEVVHVPTQARAVRLTAASTITPRPVDWHWVDRIPAAEITLTPGRGGVGKSTFHAWIIAHTTRGTLPGVHDGTARPCVIAASEDSWSRTIVPRLIVAGADLDLVWRADVVAAGTEVRLTLPADTDALTDQLLAVDAAVLSVDPLMSVIDGGLDTHKNRDVRGALEPLHRLADRTGVAVLGNAHFTKAGTDPLVMITGSGAFSDVARAALGFARDPDDEDNPSVVVSQIKNNLGRTDLTSLRYVIDAVTLDCDAGPTSVGRLRWTGESSRSVSDILGDGASGGERSERSEVSQWLDDYVAAAGGQVRAADAIRDGKDAGFSENMVKKARCHLKMRTKREGFGKDGEWHWRAIGPIELKIRYPGTMATGGGTFGRRVVEPLEMDLTENGEKNLPSDDNRGMWR